MKTPQLGGVAESINPGSAIVVPFRTRRQNLSYYGDRHAFMTCCERWRRPRDRFLYVAHQARLAAYVGVAL